MNFKFNNYSKHTGTRGEYNWFEWLVFMDEPQEKLEQVRGVEYRLHETFPDPVRYVSEQEGGFALSSAGWGEFTILITVYLIDGTEAQTWYALDLSRTWPAAGPQGVGQ